MPWLYLDALSMFLIGSNKLQPPLCCRNISWEVFCVDCSASFVCRKTLLVCLKATLIYISQKRFHNCHIVKRFTYFLFIATNFAIWNQLYGITNKCRVKGNISAIYWFPLEIVSSNSITIEFDEKKTWKILGIFKTMLDVHLWKPSAPFDCTMARKISLIGCNLMIGFSWKMHR